nr:MAG TPA: hypothetical protein [Herelleviridae sp.]
MSKTYQEAVATMSSYLSSEDVMSNTSSISISFVENWTGSKERYVMDTMTKEVALRVFSLETAHVVLLGDSLPKDSTESADMLSRLKKEFKQASKEFKQAIAEGDSK